MGAVVVGAFLFLKGPRRVVVAAVLSPRLRPRSSLRIPEEIEMAIQASHMSAATTPYPIAPRLVLPARRIPIPPLIMPIVIRIRPNHIWMCDQKERRPVRRKAEWCMNPKNGWKIMSAKITMPIKGCGCCS